MLSARMPFPRVPCEIVLPTFAKDSFGNEVATYDGEPIETECSFAPGLYRTASTDDSYQPADPHGDDTVMTFFFPKELDEELRGAIVRIDVGGGRVSEFHVVGNPRSYMRDATPGDMSWSVEVVEHRG